MVSMSVHQFSDLLPKRLMDKFLQDQQLKGEAACYESRLLYVVPPDGLPREEVVTRVRSLVQPVLNFKWNVVYRDFHDLSLFYELREQHGVVEISFSDSEVRKVYFRSATKVGLNVLDTIITAMLQDPDFSTVVEQPGRVALNYVFPLPSGSLEHRTRYFALEPLDSIAQNYSPFVVERLRETIAIIREAQKGLVILNGPPGTGKTHLLRAILSEVAPKTGVICSPPIEFLTKMQYLAQALTDSSSSLVVLEDIGDVLTQEAASEHVQVYANLLNLTDGLLSLLNESVVLLTFNTEIGKIDEALLRPGRCISHIEVGALEREHAKKLVRAAGIAPDAMVKGSYTLAEVYEIIRTQDAQVNFHTSSEIGLLVERMPLDRNNLPGFGLNTVKSHEPRDK